MGLFQHWPIILILVIVLIILGPGKLPQIGGAIGGAIKEFRKSTSEKDAETKAAEAASPSPVVAAALPAEPKKESPEPPRA